MATSVAALKAQFDMQTRLFNNVLEDIKDSDANTRNHPNVNHIKWVAGHVLNTRIGSLTRMTGGQPDDSYAAQFARGAALDPNATYPSIADIKAKWNETAPGISEAITKIPEETLSAPAPGKAPIHDDTMLGLLAFFVSHEAHHIGQLSILRKMAGKDAMSYK